MAQLDTLVIQECQGHITSRLCVIERVSVRHISDKLLDMAGKIGSKLTIIDVLTERRDVTGAMQRWCEASTINTRDQITTKYGIDVTKRHMRVMASKLLK